MEENQALIEKVLDTEHSIEFLKGIYRWADQNLFILDNFI